MPNDLHRYLLALPRGEGRVFLAWRLLARDRPSAPFHVERRRADDGKWERVTPRPITDSTNFLDATPAPDGYQYRVLDEEGRASETVTVDSRSPATICAVDAPLPGPVLGAGRIGLGDLTNDGLIGYVVSTMVDGEFTLFAYRHDGESMWSFRTGLPSAAGNTPFTVWDVNADGRTEVIVRRGRDAWADELERVRRGEEPTKCDHRKTPIPEGETLVALDAETGEIAWEVPLEGPKLSMKMTAGQIRGLDQPGAVIFQVGTYRDLWNTAYDGRDGGVLWRVEQARGAGHDIDVADIDGDGVQEVISGGVCYNGDGTVRWEAESFGHTDISKPTVIDPGREGLQIWYAVERENAGVYFVDNRGRTIFKEPFRHAHYGWIARHTTEFPGLQPHTAEDVRHEYSGAGDGWRDEKAHFPIFLPDGRHWLNLTDWQRKNFVPVHWDAGPVVVFAIRKENKRIVRLLPTGEIEELQNGKLPEGARLGRNLGCADVIGDFRENIVTVDEERGRLVVLANPNVATCRGYSPYDDFAYRHDRSQHGSGYYIYVSPPDTRVNP